MQELLDFEPNQGASSACSDGVGPETCTHGGCYQSHKIYNNITYDGQRWQGGYGMAFGVSGAWGGTEPRVRVDNNLSFDTSGPCIASGPGGTYCSFASWQAADLDGDGVTEDIHGMNVAPQFVSYSGHDYRAAAASAPQVNAGANTALLPCPADDFLGKSRSDGACDIGAHEY
jgi:hypothetical protein